MYICIYNMYWNLTPIHITFGEAVQLIYEIWPLVNDNLIIQEITCNTINHNVWLYCGIFWEILYVEIQQKSYICCLHQCKSIHTGTVCTWPQHMPCRFYTLLIHYVAEFMQTHYLVYVSITLLCSKYVLRLRLNMVSDTFTSMLNTNTFHSRELMFTKFGVPLGILNRLLLLVLCAWISLFFIYNTFIASGSRPLDILYIRIPMRFKINLSRGRMDKSTKMGWVWAR